MFRAGGKGRRLEDEPRRRYTLPMAKPFLRAIALSSVLWAALAVSAYTPDPPPDIEILDTQEAGSATLILETNVSGADIYLNKVFIGRTPHKQTGLSPGIHILRFELDGYRTRDIVLDLLEKRTYTINVKLIPRTGWIAISVSPSDARVYVDGSGVSGTLVETPVGSHVVRAYRFGYEEAYQSVYVSEEGVAAVTFRLSPSAFTLSELRLRKPSFNPSNIGALGTAEIRFTVTSFGSAEVEIRDSAGSLVGTLTLPPFTENRQTAVWDGRNDRGGPLPDGVYTIRVRAVPEDSAGSAISGVLERTASVSIDSSLLVAPRGLSGGISGLTLYPDPFVDPARVLRFGAAWKPRLTPNGALDRSTVALGAQASLDGFFEIAIQGILDPQSSDSGSLGLGIKRTLFDAASFHAAAYASAALSSGTASEEPASPSPIRAGITAAGGRARAFGGLALEIEVPSWEEPVPRMAVRAGLSLADGRRSAGLSAVFRTEAFDGPFALSPTWTAVLEARSFLAALPFALGVSIGADFGLDGLVSLRPAAELTIAF